MRIGWPSPSPAMTPRSPPPPSAPSPRSFRASAASPIDVAGDSDDDFEEEEAPRSPDRLAYSNDRVRMPVRTPMLRLSSTSPLSALRVAKKRSLDQTSLAPPRRRRQYESSDDSEDGTAVDNGRSRGEQQTNGGTNRLEALQKKKASPPLDFFFNMDDRNTPRKQMPTGNGVHRLQNRSRSSSARNSPAREEETHRQQTQPLICATRTCICGEKFGRCELLFGADRVELTIWKKNTRCWQGTIKYSQLARFWYAAVDLMGRRLVNGVATWHLLTGFVPRSVLEEEEEPSYVNSRSRSDRGRTLFLSRRRDNGTASPAYSEEENAPIQIGGERVNGMNGGAAGDGVETVVLIESAQQHEAPDGTANAPSSSPSRQEEDHERVEIRKRKTARRREEEEAKRRKIKSRRNELLLSYPYEESETAGRISVTLGDVDRLVPGEFLNDNIIDFYLRFGAVNRVDRFLWRHLELWQQQQMYFFSSHFFTQLNGTNGAHELVAANPDERFARVARWTLKETNLFDKRFLFIPINDRYRRLVLQGDISHGILLALRSAIIKKRRITRRRPRQEVVEAHVKGPNSGEMVDLVDNFSYFRKDGVVDVDVENGSAPDAVEGDDDHPKTEEEVDVEEIEEEELPLCQEARLVHPPCLLFLDSLRCHRKKKFTNMLRNYLECEWKARFASSETDDAGGAGAPTDVAETIVTSFDADSIGLLEPNIPLQSNSSDCGVFLLMYAAAIVRQFPAGVSREDLESHLASTLTPDMFGDEHVLEFRDYLQQLLFCLQSLQERGLSEIHVRDEELEAFTISN
ncbi:hypothetical protein BBJ28_00014268 [Nothophytophthora sp. Chile5]|nr:hypothetical protein BBJ28_00014268 [Nothophytophthora sp. Chile5]